MNLQPFERLEGDLRITADVNRERDLLEFRYAIEGNSGQVAIAPPEEPLRTDGLWQSTCFEAFIDIGNDSYIELNFSPSGQWAAYRFTDYRQGMNDLDIAQPTICFIDNHLIARLESVAEPGAAFNLTAVIKLKNGDKSYWALAHPQGESPDFHARDCFVGKLP